VNRCATPNQVQHRLFPQLWSRALSKPIQTAPQPNFAFALRFRRITIAPDRYREEDDTMIGAYSFDGINFWAVLVCAIASMVIGFLWYSPILFAKPWTRLMGIDLNDKARLAEMRKGAGKLYGISFIVSLVSAVVLAKIIQISSVDTILYGMKIGFAVWLGFVTTVQLTGTLFSKQPTKLYLINTGYQLVCYLAMGAILAKWPQ
jgi:hypothetical protein